MSHTNFPKSPEPNAANRRPASIDRYGAKSATAGDIPFGDPQARYSISYVPGMSEHVVNTGKTLPEAQLKVVLLACEVERLNTLNYNLVKENEILKSQAKKTDREADLETKLAIVLAENEKLNQIVEELHSVYARERESLTNEDYERRIAELLQDLEESKRNPQARTHHDLQALEKERDMLTEQLGRQGRDLEALRAHLASFQAGTSGSADSRFHHEQVTTFKIENDKLRSELDAMKVKYGGNADDLQHRLNQYDSKLRVLLSENEKLNNLILEQSNHLKHLQAQGQGTSSVHIINQTTSQTRPIGSDHTRPLGGDQTRPEEFTVNRGGEEKAKSAGANVQANKEIIERLAGDNKELSSTLNDLKDKLTRMARDNERLNDLVEQLRIEHENLRSRAGDTSRINQLTLQINTLLDENRRLNDLLADKTRAYDELARRLGTESGAGDSSELRARIGILTTEIDSLNVTIRNLRAENERLQRQVLETGGSTRIDQISIQLNTLLEENRKLNDLLAERVRENDSMRIKIRDLETVGGNASVYRDKLQLVTTENERLNIVILDLRREIDNLKISGGDVSELRSRINLLTTDNENLRRQLADASSGNYKIESLTIQLNGTVDENKRLQAILLERQREIDQLRIDINELQLQSGGNRLEQLKAQLNSLLDENKRLNEGLLHKSAEIDELRRRSSNYESLQGSVKFLQSENERLNAILTERLREIDQLRARISQLENSQYQITSMEDRIKGLNGEKDRLNQLLVDRSREIDTLRIQIHELHGSQSTIEGLRSNLVLITAENERLGGLVGANLREIDALRIRIAQLEDAGRQVADLRQRLELLVADNQKLNQVISEKLRELEAQRRRILELESLNLNASDLQNRLALISGDNQKLLQERDTLRAQLTVAVAERDRFSLLLTEKVREIEAVRGDQIRVVEAGQKASGETPKNKQSGVYGASIPAKVHEEAVAGLENRILLLDLEQKRLISILSERDSEIETLKQRIGALNNIAQENDRLNQRLAEKDREIDNLRRAAPETVVPETDKARLEADYRRLLEGQISEHAGRFNEEKQQLLQVIQELESRISALAADNDRLNRLANENGQNSDSLKNRLEDLEKSKNAEIEALKASRFREQPVRAQPTGEEDQGELGDKVDYLTNEIERLQDHLNNTLKELGDWRKRYSELEVLRAQELDELRQQFTTVKKTQVDAKEQAVKFTAERVAYETQIHQLQQRVIDSDRQLQLISSENERFVRLSTTQLNEVEGQKRRQHELKASQSLELQQLRAQIEVFKANATDVKQLAIKYSADKAADQSQIKQLKQVNENYKAEIEKLYELIEQRKADFETLNRQNQELVAQYERVSHQVFETGNQASTNIEKFESIKKEVEDLRVSRDEFRTQAERNSIELTRRNKELVDRLQELDILKMKYEEGLANYQALNTRLFDKLTTEK
jgi:chromosome segregation ATPase